MRCPIAGLRHGEVERVAGLERLGDRLEGKDWEVTYSQNPPGAVKCLQSLLGGDGGVDDRNLSGP